jgi:2-oxoglutarate ferredoxin oxidoreductase subunit alpha
MCTAQADEHSGDGSIDESAENAIAQMEKRMRKMQVLKDALPGPELFGHKSPELLIVGWGSMKGPMLDVLAHLSSEGKNPTSPSGLRGARIGYLHYTYLWPLHTELLTKLMLKSKRTVVIEGNRRSQLEMLIRQETGLQVDQSILKYDGRPFFYDELLLSVTSLP